jgi:hypothetical protein
VETVAAWELAANLPSLSSLNPTSLSDALGLTDLHAASSAAWCRST